MENHLIVKNKNENENESEIIIESETKSLELFIANDLEKCSEVLVNVYEIIKEKKLPAFEKTSLRHHTINILRCCKQRDFNSFMNILNILKGICFINKNLVYEVNSMYALATKVLGLKVQRISDIDKERNESFRHIKVWDKDGTLICDRKVYYSELEEMIASRIPKIVKAKSYYLMKQKQSEKMSMIVDSLRDYIDNHILETPLSESHENVRKAVELLKSLKASDDETQKAYCEYIQAVSEDKSVYSRYASQMFNKRADAFVLRDAVAELSGVYIPDEVKDIS